MQTFIEKLGKPRSWLICVVACLAGLLLGGLCVGMYFAGLQAAGRIGYWVVLVCWVAAGLSYAGYFFGQFSGRYRDLKGKAWAELPW